MQGRLRPFCPFRNPNDWRSWTTWHKRLPIAFYPGLKPWAMNYFPNQTMLSFLNLTAMGNAPGKTKPDLADWRTSTFRLINYWIVH
jgi:hypothetical protein